ncbi:MAG: acetylxylan esterase [Muribaculaceae bacterium]|nr:acetylxylan esterase [Muribaculaceae bacterium]
MKRLIAPIFIFFATLCCLAGNYPDRSDGLWVTVPDHADWIYQCGQPATIDIQFYEYGIPADGLEVEYEIADDLMKPDKSGKLTLKNGHASLNIGTMKKSGFRDLRLKIAIGDRKFAHHVKVGFSPEKIEPYTKLPKDFNEFWEANKAELAKTPLKYEITPVEKYTTDKVKTYLVKLYLNSQKQSIYGYLMIPADAKPGSCPAVLCPPGAGIKTIKNIENQLEYANNGFIRFATEIHGLNPELTDQQFDEISRAFNGRENGYLSNNLDDRDNYYMKRVYLSLIRSVDFLSQLPEWDGRNMVIQGGSQGGALSIVGAALDPRITLCVANHPALADMARFRINEADGYPHFSRVEGMDTDDKVATMAYYDVVNFARNLKTPLYMTWGYNDDTCPPTTSYAVWNVVTSPKESLLTPINEHWTSKMTNTNQIHWIKSHLK